MGLLLTHGGADLLLSRNPAPLWGGVGGHGGRAVRDGYVLFVGVFGGGGGTLVKLLDPRW